MTRRPKGHTEPAAGRKRQKASPGDRQLRARLAEEQQRAASEILRAISSHARRGEQPLFEVIAEAATALCDADHGSLFRLDGGVIHFVAHHGRTPEQLVAAWTFPQPPAHHSVVGRAILGPAVVHIADVRDEPNLEEALRTFETVLAVPLVSQGSPLGALTLARRVGRPFTDQQIVLLERFADQAAMALVNVRLFKELEARNRELTEALERQTATGEILRVISSSPLDLQPVFEAIARNAVVLCQALSGAVFHFDGELIHLVAHHNFTPEVLDLVCHVYPMRPSRDQATGRVILGGALVQLHDALADPEYRQEIAVRGGWRSMLAVPMSRAGAAIGVIWVARAFAGPFSDNQIGLLKMFADQAVIGIEIVRLFKELETRTQELTRSVSELRALGEVGQAISSTLDLQAVLSTIVARATQLSGTDAGVIYEYDEHREVFVPRATAHLEAEIIETMLATPVRRGEGATGRLAQAPEAVELPDVLAAPAGTPVRDALVRAGYRALLAVPLVREGHLLGGLTVIRKATGAFAPEVIELLRTFATQSALAIQNARLFLEIEDKSRQLELASQHKSEFLANMSHELRTPLNAIIGFSQVLAERMFGELNEKQAEYLTDIHASGQHLLSLINDILDLSKIEAGRMELELTDVDLPRAIDNALILVRERASRSGIQLGREIDTQLRTIRADERKVKQVLLNLLSNALKFTPEGGRIDVQAHRHDDQAEISVADTGVGIAPEDQEAVFEEFRQVGPADKKIEGTGLGLTLCRKFVELHGGRIWVTSQVGVGSTFTFTLPVRIA